MKSFKTTLILLLIVAAVGAYIWFNERGPIAEQGSVVLLRTDPARVQEIELVNEGKAIELRRSGEDWKAQEKASGKEQSTLSAPADEDAVKNLLESLQLVQSANVVPADAAKLKEFGLEKSQKRLSVDGTTIEFGSSPSFDSTRIYARIGEQIALLPATLGEAAAKPFSDWRDKAVLRVVADEVTTLKLQSSNSTIVFEGEVRQDEEPRTWKMTQPVSAQADASAVDGLLSQLATSQASQFLAETPRELKSWGLEKPQLVIQADDATLKIGRKTNGGYAAQNSTSPAVFEVPETLVSQARRPLKDWRVKQVLDFKFDDISRFEVKARGASKTLEKKDEKWREVGGEASDATHQAAFDVLLAVQGLSAQEFIDQPKSLSEYGLDKPALEVQFNQQTVQLGSKNDQAFARVAENSAFRPTVYEVPQSTLDSLKQPLDTLLAKNKDSN